MNWEQEINKLEIEIFEQKEYLNEIQEQIDILEGELENAKLRLREQIKEEKKQ